MISKASNVCFSGTTVFPIDRTIDPSVDTPEELDALKSALFEGVFNSNRGKGNLVPYSINVISPRMPPYYLMINVQLPEQDDGLDVEGLRPSKRPKASPAEVDEVVGAIEDLIERNTIMSQRPADILQTSVDWDTSYNYEEEGAFANDKSKGEVKSDFNIDLEDTIPGGEESLQEIERLFGLNEQLSNPDWEEVHNKIEQNAIKLGIHKETIRSTNLNFIIEKEPGKKRDSSYLNEIWCWIFGNDNYGEYYKTGSYAGPVNKVDRLLSIVG